MAGGAGSGIVAGQRPTRATRLHTVGIMPPVTTALIVANVAIYLIQASILPGLFLPFALWPVGSGVASGGQVDFHLWQIVTYGFLHGGLPHLLFNMFGLYMFGPQVEYRWGSQRFLVYYLLCGLGSALLYIGWLWYGAREHLAMLDTEQLAVLRDQFIQWTQNGTVSREITPDMAA